MNPDPSLVPRVIDGPNALLAIEEPLCQSMRMTPLHG